MKHWLGSSFLLSSAKRFFFLGLITLYPKSINKIHENYVFCESIISWIPVYACCSQASNQASYFAPSSPILVNSYWHHHELPALVEYSSSAPFSRPFYITMAQIHINWLNIIILQLRIDIVTIYAKTRHGWGFWILASSWAIMILTCSANLSAIVKEL